MHWRLDLPPLSSRPQGEISNRPRSIPRKEQRDFSLRFEMTTGAASRPSPLSGTTRFLAPLRNDSGGGISAFALSGTMRFLAPLRNDNAGIPIRNRDDAHGHRRDCGNPVTCRCPVEAGQSAMMHAINVPLIPASRLLHILPGLRRLPCPRLTPPPAAPPGCHSTTAAAARSRRSAPAPTTPPRRAGGGPQPHGRPIPGTGRSPGR